MSEPTEIDRRLDTLTEAFASGVNALSSNPMLRDGLVKTAIVDVIWALYNEMPDNREAIAEGLEQMDDIIRKAAREEKSPAN